MANTYYDSQLTAAEIEAALEAIAGVIVPANNGKVLAINNGKLEARSVQWGGGEPVLEPLSVTANGDYTPEAGVDGFYEVHVSVPNSYSASDEGKVVNNGALVAQTAHSEITENGTYDTTLNNEVTVNVSGGSGDILSGTTAPTSSLGNNGDIYKQIFPVANGINYVDYLKSTGSQYINTGIMITVGLDMFLKGISNNVSSWVVGSRNESPIDSSTIDIVASFSADKTHYCHKSYGLTHTYYGKRIQNGDYYEDQIKTKGFGDNNKVMQSTTSNGETTSMVSNTSSPPDSANNYPIVLFGINDRGSITKGTNISICRVVFFDGIVPIADYLPCLDGNGVACMWDNIAGQYVYNDGTGDFLYGSAVTPDPLDDVYYLKENGAWHVIQQ